MKINLDIVNDVTYKHVKFQYYKIRYIMGYTKIKNYGNICRFENIYNRSTRLSFLCSPKYKIFEYEILHIYRIKSWLYSNIFHNFLKLKNMIFDILFKKKQDHWCPCASNLQSFFLFLHVIDLEMQRRLDLSDSVLDSVDLTQYNGVPS
jgi:hypothetical protein